MSVFDDIEAQTKVFHIEEHGIDVIYVEKFLDPVVATTMYEALQTEADWHRPKMQFAGVEHETRRQVAWHADFGFTYRYSGQEHRWVAWSPAMQQLRAKVQDHMNMEFNGVLLNWYKDGSEYVSAHSDDERDMEPDVPIVALSLGAVRDFVIKHKELASRHTIPLAHGSLLTMQGDTQKVAKHGIPKRPNCTEGRISLTFRRATRKST